MNFSIITFNPNFFESNVVLCKAKKTKDSINIKCYNPINYKVNNYTVNTPYGGGPGVVIEPLCILNTYDYIMEKHNHLKTTVLIMSPGGKKFTNEYARSLIKEFDHIVFISGKYEGIDNRVTSALNGVEISIGDYILTSGDLPIAVIIDSISRQIYGVLGNVHSIEEDRISCHKIFTRPPVINYNNKELKVPDVLLSGNLKEINKWKMVQRNN